MIKRGTKIRLKESLKHTDLVKGTVCITEYMKSFAGQSVTIASGRFYGWIDQCIYKIKEDGERYNYPEELFEKDINIMSL